MYFDEIEETPDLQPQEFYRGNSWYAQFRLPWGIKLIMDRETKRPKRFDDRRSAREAAEKALRFQFRNRVTGMEVFKKESQEDAKKVFKDFD